MWIKIYAKCQFVKITKEVKNKGFNIKLQPLNFHQTITP